MSITLTKGELVEATLNAHYGAEPPDDPLLMTEKNLTQVPSQRVALRNKLKIVIRGDLDAPATQNDVLQVIAVVQAHSASTSQARAYDGDFQERVGAIRDDVIALLRSFIKDHPSSNE